MTQVQIDWLTLLLAPLALVGLVVALSAKLSSSRKGRPMPGWANAIQGVAIAFVLLVAVMNMAWGNS